MTNEENKNALDYLHKAIESKVYCSKNEARILVDYEEMNYIMDFRKILLEADTLDLLAELFLDMIGEQLFQVGGLETSSVPLISAIVMKTAKTEKKTSGFFVRKSRKKTGLLNMVEGEISDRKIILVDDIINSGKSMMRQVKVLESLGHKVDTVITILRYRDEEYYQELCKRGITIKSLFTLDDFSESLGVKNLINPERSPIVYPLRKDWQFKSEGALYEYVIPKSAPLLDEGTLYFGSDNGTFWALDAVTGEVKWSRNVMFGWKGKKIFSSPCIFKDTVFFGAYNGNMYALDKKTGAKKWIAHDADWIGSSPCVSESLEMVYVGMEFGYWKQRGGVAAYDTKTGKRVWQSESIEFTHGSPSYSKKYGMVVCGSNDGTVYGLNAKNGLVVWMYNSSGSVKAGCALSPSERYVAFGSLNKEYIVLETGTGKMVSLFKTLEGNYSTPIWEDEGNLICTSLDKKIYKFDVKEQKQVWEHSTKARIFASPEIYDGKVWIGNNAALLYVLDINTGKEIFLYQTVERITNKVAIDKQNNKIYLPTFANEIIALTFDR